MRSIVYVSLFVSMMVRCYWCISILIIIPTIKCCSLTGPPCGWSAVMLSDRRSPSFWNFDSTISIDVIRMKSYMDSLFDPTCVYQWGSRSINLTSFQIGRYPVSLAYSETAEVCARASRISLSCSFILSCIAFPVSYDYVDGFLQHLNSQEPTIRFTMEIEKDNTIPFLDTSVSRDSNGLLTTTVYWKPTHTDQYLAYDSHHPQSVKRGIVKCLYDRAKHLTSKPSAISKEKKHLSSVLVSNGYPFSFVRKPTKTTRPTANKEPTQELNLLRFYPT